MTKRDTRTKLYIEASAIIEPRMSGIGHTIVSIIRALIADDSFTSRYRIILLVPNGTKSALHRWKFPAHTVEARQLWLEKHVFQVLFKYGFLPPMDLFYGKAIYLFPNYKNWPLLFSRSLTYIYDVAFMVHPDTVQPKNLAMLQRNVPKWIGRTDFILTVSENSRREINEYLHVPANQIGVVYCGVNDDEYGKRPHAEVASAKHKYKITGDYILFVGNIEPRKNINRLLDAYTLLPEHLREQYSLVLIGGGGWLNQDILAKIQGLREQGYKIIHPSVYVPDADLPKLYSGASLLVHPAIHEGFGIPPLQAMASGIPVALSNTTSLPEVAGKAGAYFDPRDTTSIADIIGKTLTDTAQREELIRLGQQQAARFSWSKSVKELEKYIERLAGVRVND